MLFNSFLFVFFFLVVYSFYIILRHKEQNILLLLASYFFYGYWDWRFLILIWISTVVDYTCGLIIHSLEDKKRRKIFLILSICTNLSILGFFKYFNFFAEGLVDLLALFALKVDSVTLHVVLPVGISFYTFQTMSYTIDVYRKKLKPTKSFINFALFVAFFPQLVAGPIERAISLLPQVEKARPVTYQRFKEGIWLVLRGYFKKVVLADNMVPITEAVFTNPQDVYGLSIIIAIYAFTFQIYGDFSGYSDIARGIAKLFGFDLMLNFRRPYFSTNPRDFWKRWHISLSTWLRDYLYIPLGGSRHGILNTHKNLFITMLLCGLWHGASWNFVAWGLYHGAILSIYNIIAESIESLRKFFKIPLTLWRPVCMMFFFHVVCLGWLLFAVQNLYDVPALLHNIFVPFEENNIISIITIMIFAIPLLIVEMIDENSGIDNAPQKWSRPWQLVYFTTVFLIIFYSGSINKYEFIYFQF